MPLQISISLHCTCFHLKKKKKAIQHFQTDEMDSIEIEMHILHTVLLEI